jgi:hypothetical protein
MPKGSCTNRPLVVALRGEAVLSVSGTSNARAMHA